MTDRSDHTDHPEEDNTALLIFAFGMSLLAFMGLLKGILWLVGRLPM